MKPDKLYLYSIMLFMLILPVISLIIDNQVFNRDQAFIFLIGKWFVFWAIGVRLLIAGFKQVSDPAFTLEKIFNIKSIEGQIIVRELGFANICMGVLGTISLFGKQFRLSAAIAGGLFLGIAGVYHIIKKPVSKNETIAMVSDLLIFLIMAAYVFNSFI
jgi:hypothetical protein